MRRPVSSLVLTLALAAPALAGDPPDAIDYSMFFLADVRDSPECVVSATPDGRIGYGPEITNPAASCPDAFAWQTFIEAVAARFWEDWTTDEQMWPTDPWPRCAGGAGSDCCAAVEVSNDPRPANCPVFPGPTEGVPDHHPHEPTKAHQVGLGEAAAGDADGDGLGEWEDVPAVLKTAVIGNEQKELVYRNRPMVDYVFEHELYFTEGLAAVVERLENALAAYAPYHPRPPRPLAADGPSRIVQVDFPTRSVMVKANWLATRLAPQLGIDVEANSPYVVMDLSLEEGRPKEPYLLLSFHISTKDLPNWFWATFEHVDNQGRCDWTGCNDGFGYPAVQADLPPPAAGLAAPAANYVPPHQATDVDGAGVTAFDLAREYRRVDGISGELEALFAAFAIGTGSGDEGTGGAAGPGRPTPEDPAWRSYRLKGSQIDFVTPSGRPTRLGNSVTEAGFTNSASCISCHARAGADAEGLPPLAIFVDELSDAGLPKSFNGTPVEAWFDVNAYYGVGGQREAPGVRAVPLDFVWGFRNACPMAPRELGPSRCAKVKPED